MERSEDLLTAPANADEGWFQSYPAFFDFRDWNLIYTNIFSCMEADCLHYRGAEALSMILYDVSSQGRLLGRIIFFFS